MPRENPHLHPLFAGAHSLGTVRDALNNSEIDPLFYATIEATEEAIINSMLASETMVGIDGNKRYALPHDEVLKHIKGI